MATPANRTGQRARPLSPHIQVYSPLINMIMSIVHRMTGAALYVGTVLLAWWLLAAAMGPEAYETMSSVLGSWPGTLVLIGYCWALLHHMFGGIRHFIWDMGKGFELQTADMLAWGTAVASFGATVLVCLFAFAGGA